MDKTIRNLDGRIGELGAEISRLEARKFDAENRIAAVKEAIPVLMEALKTAMVEGGDVLALEKRRRELADDRRRDELLLEGLSEKMEELEQQLSQAIEARGCRFGELAVPWLAREISSHNELAERLTQSLKRLAAAHNVLREVGRTESFINALGPSWRYFGQTKLIPLGGAFQPTDATGRAKFQPTRPLCDAVFAEVTK